VFKKSRKVFKFALFLLLANLFLITSALPALASPDVVITTNPMIIQSSTWWCWAASATSILRISGYSSLTQSSFANTVQGNLNNVGRHAEQVANDFYTHYGKSTTYALGTLSFSSIQTRINANKPIFSQVDWSTDGAHIVVISGYDVTGQMLRIMDPASSLGGIWQYVSRTDFVSGGYGGNGTWTLYFYVN